MKRQLTDRIFALYIDDRTDTRNCQRLFVLRARHGAIGSVFAFPGKLQAVSKTFPSVTWGGVDLEHLQKL